MLRIDSLDKRIADKLIYMVGKTQRRYKDIQADAHVYAAMTKLLGYLGSVSFGIPMIEDVLDEADSEFLNDYYQTRCKPLAILTSNYATFTQLLECMLFAD
jgi:hypothetical protein